VLTWQTSCGLTALALVSTVFTLGAQTHSATARVVIEGGPQSGVYDLIAAPSGCSLRMPTSKLPQFDLELLGPATMLGSATGNAASRLVIQTKDAAGMGFGTTHASVSFEIGKLGPASATWMRWDTQDSLHSVGHGILTLRGVSDSVTATFNGTTRDSIKFSGTLRCFITMRS
jgi:hypothetical protein